MALDVSELDFDLIKDNLITFFQAQDEFSDYDFTGSGLNVLIDALAYATHYMGVQSHVTFAESFIDSAQFRSSVVSKAKELGYNVKSPMPAKVEFTLTLDLTAVGSPPTSFIVPSDTIFYSGNASIDGIPFQTVENQTLTDTGVAAGGSPTKILSGTIVAYQGLYQTQEWDIESINDRFIIDEPTASTQFMRVNTSPFDGSPVQQNWETNLNFVDIDDTTYAYFTSEVDGELIEVYFGNDVIGVMPSVGEYLTIEYFTTSGLAGNGYSQFKTTAIGAYTANQFTISDITKSYGGTDRETITSIRKAAPLNYQAQNRLVTAEDYRGVLLSEYSNIDQLNVWGGQYNDPPKYGKVLICIKPISSPNNDDLLTVSDKEYIKNYILAPRSVLGVVPEFIDPDYLYIIPTVKVYYNDLATTLKMSQIETAVSDAIAAYFTGISYEFDAEYKHSRFQTAIDSANESILSNISTIEIMKKLTVTYGVLKTYTLTFGNAVVAESIYSNSWTNVNGKLAQIKDDGEGNLDLWLDNALYLADIGTINYSTGAVVLTSFDAGIPEIEDQIISFYAEPQENNIRVNLNNLLVGQTPYITIIARSSVYG